jgi:hypothetical protein
VPHTRDSTSRAAIAYFARLEQVINKALAGIRSLVASDHGADSLAHAFAVEAHGQQIIGQEIPALKQKKLARVGQLGNQARRLTAPADATIRKARLGICVSS